MGKYIDLMANFLTEDDWSYKTYTAEDGGIFLRSPYAAKHCTFDVVFDASDSKDWVMIFIYPNIYTPEKYQHTIAELICRLNQRITLGCFEFDFSENTIRFRSAIDIEGGELTSTIFFNLLKSALITMDKSFPAFMAALYGDITPEAALQKYLLLCKNTESEPTNQNVTTETISVPAVVH